jgi:hypothetical protein
VRVRSDGMRLAFADCGDAALAATEASARKEPHRYRLIRAVPVGVIRPIASEESRC